MKIDHFNLLPNETLIQIFNFLGIQQLGRIEQVCQRFRSLVNDSQVGRIFVNQISNLSYINQLYEKKFSHWKDLKKLYITDLTVYLDQSGSMNKHKNYIIKEIPKLLSEYLPVLKKIDFISFSGVLHKQIQIKHIKQIQPLFKNLKLEFGTNISILHDLFNACDQTSVRIQKVIVISDCEFTQPSIWHLVEQAQNTQNASLKLFFIQPPGSQSLNFENILMRNSGNHSNFPIKLIKENTEEFEPPKKKQKTV